MIFQHTIQLAEHDEGTYEITDLIANLIKESKVNIGTCHLFVHSSSASLYISDFADENTKTDTAEYMARLAPRGFDATQKITDGINAVPDLYKFSAINTNLTIPVTNAKPGIGIWQSIYLWENTSLASERRITVTIIGAKMQSGTSTKPKPKTKPKNKLKG